MPWPWQLQMQKRRRLIDLPEAFLGRDPAEPQLEVIVSGLGRCT